MEQMLFPSKTLRKLLTLFLLSPRERFYLRAMERVLKEPASSLQRHLALLEAKKVLRSERVGPLKYFSLNNGFPYLEELRSIFLREKRREELARDFRKVLHLLKTKYRPEKVILFGSFGAQGRVEESSDLDLCIIKKDVPKRYWDRVWELAPLLKDCKVGIDFVVWTPQELARGQAENLFLQEEILRKGKVVYEKAA